MSSAQWRAQPLLKATYQDAFDSEARSELGNTQAPSPRASQLAGQPAGHLKSTSVSCLVSVVSAVLCLMFMVYLCGPVWVCLGPRGRFWVCLAAMRYERI